jgi:hypothetical protein
MLGGGAVPEDSPKLFSTRGNRYPDITEADMAPGPGTAVLATIPVAGGTLAEVLSAAATPAAARWWRDWIRDVGDGLDQLEAKVGGFKVKTLHQDEAFVIAFIEASRFAFSTHLKEKRDALRNALLNIALRRPAEEDQQERLLRLVNELTVWHIRILFVFQDSHSRLAAKGLSWTFDVGGGLLEVMYPELVGERDFYDQIIADLHNQALLNSASGLLHTMMTGDGMVAKRTTPLGDDILAFIENPLDG